MLKKSICLTMLALASMPMTANADIVINEIMYDPISSDNGASAEWIELYNTGLSEVDLSGYGVTAGTFTAFTFPSGSTIAPNGYVLLTGLDPDTFASYYKGGVDSSILYKLENNAMSKLSNGVAGATITIKDSTAATVDTVSYRRDGDWPGAAAGGANNLGYSMELLDPTFDNTLPASWQVSFSHIGTPGKANSRLGSTWYTAAGRSVVNPGTADSVTISIITFTSSTITSVEGFVAQGMGNTVYTPVTMTNGGSGSIYTGALGTFPDKTLVKYYIKITDAEGVEAYYPPLAPALPEAFSVANSPITASQLIINEVQIDPAGTDNATNSEYFELYNRTSDPIDLSYYVIGRSLDDSYWRMIPEGTVIAPHDYAVIAGRKASLLTQFTSASLTMIPATVPVVDLAWRVELSVLANSGTTVFLASPNAFKWSDLWEELTLTPMIYVNFTLGANDFPTAAQINSHSAELTDEANDPTLGASWKPSTATKSGTPGVLNSRSSVTDWSIF